MYGIEFLGYSNYEAENSLRFRNEYYMNVTMMVGMNLKVCSDWKNEHNEHCKTTYEVNVKMQLQAMCFRQISHSANQAPIASIASLLEVENIEVFRRHCLTLCHDSQSALRFSWHQWHDSGSSVFLTSSSPLCLQLPSQHVTRAIQLMNMNGGYCPPEMIKKCITNRKNTAAKLQQHTTAWKANEKFRKGDDNSPTDHTLHFSIVPIYLSISQSCTKDPPVTRLYSAISEA